jgi:hypothetical protein
MRCRRYPYVMLLGVLLLFVSLAASQQIVVDHTADGSQYELAIPGVWNGSLVVYGHGIVDPQAPVALPNVGALRDALLANGFAVAYSSFPSNGSP